ncbi:MAG: hypothetical protein IJ493_03405 [Clostridia bacterium]|nr:hypothetical protein [Clostridia bacterium]
MKRTRYFNYRPEESQNPYIGFVSFQHFCGEKLYSDTIVRPEANMCETKNVECYPIPDGVAENDREQGFYPDTTVAYIRVLWKEIEPGGENRRPVENRADMHGILLVAGRMEGQDQLLGQPHGLSLRADRMHLRGADKAVDFITGIDIMKWFPGKTKERISITLPDDLPAGDYNVELGIFNENIPLIYLCTDAERDGSYYHIGKVQIS